MFSPTMFTGRTALVTGGTSGIGLAIAERLGSLGARTAIIGRDEHKLEAATAALADKGLDARGYQADVRDEAAVLDALEAIEADFGPVGLLVNNAAGNFRVNPLDLTPNGWNAVVDIVLNGTWNLTQAVGRRAIGSSLPLSVVNIGTSAALLGNPETVHSASAKAGVLAMTKSLAAAWAPHGIRLNVLTPGLTAGTGGAGILYGTQAEIDTHLATIPLGRLARKEEIADACAFLLSDVGGYITGTELLVDGGRRLTGH
ncbi:SDR family oxidoreductase [Pseudarthrobacter enclensis]|uniref:NAD(P)-dependent dehydrogenase (Short-subunit alcohol dehydrogenase family) n=1 Tax=Pseudarthrobacter enclensis TaxID=993070 RepID=A0ABT9RXK8_9MICC|nr:SDR family oxidoreductase [Pseudarthrobacter enclensis]MDP9889980.1 NAD(P)-dependent dehydrogenase (short-subunit alcohol dehydrogenase family) [Pseudarthrobacter enclensis]